ncbi:MAG TPA: SDR family oxidoreductase [Gemmatimonadaceae bacterium]|nr:SDR family oxidoreductase [Gemmatimonadaceae bacterium]
MLTGVGAEGQVGEAVANAFAELGASLVLVDRSPEKAQARANAIVAREQAARGYGCDLADPAAVAALASAVRAEHGDKLRALVHMAGGFAMSGPVAESSLEVWDRQITINLTTAYVTARAFLPMLRAGRGSIVFFSSLPVAQGAPAAEMSAYSVAKSGVAALMRAIAAEERVHGVRANAVAPASIRTASNVASMGEKVRYIEREQVADAVTFLCSEAASAITGQLVALT